MKFFENAREGKNHWLRYLGMYFLVLIISEIAGVIIAIPFVVLNFDEMKKSGPQAPPDFEALLTGFPGLVLTMLAIILMGAFLWLLYKPFHHRERMTLISGERKFRAKHFLWGILAYGAVMLIVAAATLITEDYVFKFEGARFLWLAALCLLLVPFQAGAEELLFRGYLLPGFSACTRSKIWALIISSLLFGLMHSANNEVEAYGFMKMMPLYVLVGAQLAFFAVLSNGIEFSVGMHFINNFLAFTLLGDENGTLNICPLFTIKVEGVTFYDYLWIILETAAIYFALRKKMGWNIKEAFSSSDLTKPLEPPMPAPPPLPEL